MQVLIASVNHYKKKILQLTKLYLWISFKIIIKNIDGNRQISSVEGIHPIPALYKAKIEVKINKSLVPRLTFLKY